MPARRTSGSPPPSYSPWLDAQQEDVCVDSIPTSEELRGEIDRYVTKPQTNQAERLAAWCVREYQDFIRVHHKSYATFQYDRDIDSEIVQRAQVILLEKGWKLGQIDEGYLCLSPCRPSARSVRRPSRIV